jgi:hypothetical protein
MKAMNSLKYLGLAALTSSLAFATNITINDLYTDYTVPFSPFAGQNPAGVNEAGTINSSQPNDWTAHTWDLAKFDLTGNTLSMTGGFNFKTGTGLGVGGTFAIGDIFVYTQVPFLNASDANKNSWKYVIHFDRSASGSNPTIAGNQVQYSIISNLHDTGYIYTQLPNVMYPNLPWMVGDPGQATPLLASGVATYTSSGALNSLAFQNTLSVDVSSLLTLGNDIYFHVTQRCGNDILWGHTTGRVPDGGFTLVLVSLGLAGLALAVRRRK